MRRMVVVEKLLLCCVELAGVVLVEGCSWRRLRKAVWRDPDPIAVCPVQPQNSASADEAKPPDRKRYP